MDGLLGLPLPGLRFSHFLLRLVDVLQIVNNLGLWRAIIAANLALLMQSVGIEAFGGGIISGTKLDSPESPLDLDDVGPVGRLSVKKLVSLLKRRFGEGILVGFDPHASIVEELFCVRQRI